MIKTVKIGNGITSIGDYAFSWCTELINVTIPDSVISIGDWAFESCESLTNITIPDSVTSIGDSAFTCCDSLISITIPNSVKRIGESPFSRCSNLASINVDTNNKYYSNDSYGVLFNKNKTNLIQFPAGNSIGYEIPNSVTSIGGWAFDGCSCLTSIIIPDSVTRIGDYAFQSCETLKCITIPDSMTSISNGMFANCKKLTSIIIPDSVSNIGKDAFRNCAGIANITIPNSITKIESFVFYQCTGLTSVTIPDSVTSIGDYAFGWCYNLKSIEIPDSVISIGDEVFYNCDKLTSVTIPDSVTSIGDYAFPGCNRLESVHIPASVTNIGVSIFNYTSAYICSDSEVCYAKEYADVNNIEFKLCDGSHSIDDLSELRLSSTYPTKGATKLSYEDDLVLTFNMDVERNLSTLNEDGICIGIYDYYTDELVKSFDGLYAGYKHSGKTMTFEDAFRKLEPGKKYYILIADDAIYSKTGDSTLYFKGIKDKNEWTFSYLNPTDKTGYSLDVYSSQNVFTVNKGEADDVSIVLSLNGEVCNQDGISLAVADGNIAEISNIRREEEQTVVTIKGKNLGSTIVTVTDAGSRTVQKFPVFVSDKENVYYFSEVEKYSEYSPFVISDMYIDNFNHSEQTDGSHSVTFSVYNMGHSYGAVDVYDQNGNRVESHIINMFDGDYPTDLFTHMDYTQKLVTDFTLDIITGEFLGFSDFKDELYSKETSISITVPENGYYIITKNITASETCLLYNAISLSLDISFEAVGWIGDIVDVSEEMTETVLSKNVDKYLKKLCEVWLENGAMATAQNASASTEEILNIMEELFEAMGTTFIDAVIETIPKVTSKITKEQIAKLFLGVSLKQCGMDIVDNIFYASIKAAKWVAICTDICEYTNSPSAYIYDLQSDKTKVSNGVISYSDVDAETVFHSVLITYGYYADYIDAIHTPEADAELYSISMIKNGEKVQPETPVTVYIPLPSDWDDENIYVYHINDKYEREELNVTVENGYAKFVTGGFSYFVLSNEKLKFVDKIEILNPSNTTISYGDSIILHAETNEALPDGWYIEWAISNGNFSYDVSADGTTCTITPIKSGNTTFTVTIYDAEGNEISKDEQAMTSKAGFFDKIIAFFKKIFGLTKVIQQSLYTIY